MNSTLTQIILAARNGDGDGWINIVFIVVLAIFYVVGSILKAIKSKAEQKGDEQLAPKPGRRPPEGTKDLQKQPAQYPRRPAGPAPPKQYRPQAQPPRRKVMRPQSVVQKPAAKLEQEIELETIEPLKAPELSIPTPQLQLDLKKLPEFTVKTVKKLQDKHIGVPAETPEAKYLAEILLDYADPDELKRAILHYEILGRPLSLRGPSEHIIGL